MHSTNYFKTFIEIAEDCPAEAGEVPPMRGTKKSVANLQFEMVYDHPYEYTSDEVLFGVYAQRKGYTKNEMEEQRKLFFSKGQPCFRASPLTKRYGWGVHSDDQGKVAIYPVDSEEYQKFVQDEEVNKVKAMRSSRVKK